MSLTVGSVFSGIGGTDRAFELAGARVLWNCEIDAACRRVLRRHWPGIPRFKDVKTVTGAGLGAAGLRPDVLVGGFPCTDVSVAGKRAGLNGAQSSLFFEFARLLKEAQPEWFLLENVPGLLSSHAGRDMGTVLSTLVNLGYRCAWRVLDAQYFGVAQRRRRVFIVGRAGDRSGAAEVLLVGEGGGGDPPARRAAGEDVAGTLGGGSGSRGWCDDLDRATFVPATVPALTAGAGTNNMSPGFNRDELFIPAVSNALCSNRGQRNDHNEQTFLPVNGNTALAVRRLTPLECLRLQGFPDDWLDGLGLADSVKYRQAGNAVAVPVVTWIAERMLEVDRAR